MLRQNCHPGLATKEDTSESPTWYLPLLTPGEELEAQRRKPTRKAPQEEKLERSL